VLARVALSQNFSEEAIRLLTPVIDESNPHPDALGLLARLKLDDRQNEEAAKLYQLGTQKFPAEDRYWNGLAVALWRIDEPQRLQPVLETVAARDYNNAAVRKKLAQIAQQAEQFDDAVRWGEEAVCIDIEDAEVHTLLAACYDKLGRTDAATAAREAAQEMAGHARTEEESGEPKAESEDKSDTSRQ
jgi:Flp pilus assembly protein TadD